eukprot:1554787-Pyramimonas_sp.AAC.1
MLERRIINDPYGKQTLLSNPARSAKRIGVLIRSRTIARMRNIDDRKALQECTPGLESLSFLSLSIRSYALHQSVNEIRRPSLGSDTVNVIA